MKIEPITAFGVTKAAVADALESEPDLKAVPKDGAA